MNSENGSPCKTNDGFAVPQIRRSRSKRHFGNKTRNMPKLGGNGLQPPRRGRPAIENEIGFMASLPQTQNLSQYAASQRPGKAVDLAAYMQQANEQ